MKLTVTVTLLAITTFQMMPPPAQADSDAQKCEVAKNRIAGMYAFCRQKAEAKAVKNGDPPDYGKCDEKYGDKWALAESKAGMGVCPSEGDAAAVQAFITQHTDDVAAALAGGPLPDCTVDLSSCNGSLTTCNTSLSSCNTGLTNCAGSIVTAVSGTAAQADVLSGKTFSSGAGLGVSGTMPNNGSQVIMPGSADQAITAGYHNGSGKCAGDPDLVAANVKSGVNLFGVPGTAPPPPIRTGQTASYGTGSDGDLQKGAPRSITDNGDGTVTDNNTGLIWEKKSDDGSIHDKDNFYTWGMNVSPYTMDGEMATTFLAALNGGGGFGGHTDWRIPNLNELRDIVNYQAYGPSVGTVFNNGCVAGCTVTSCSCTLPFYYATSTTYANPVSAWTVYFWDGDIFAHDKSSRSCVRAVRGPS